MFANYGGGARARAAAGAILIFFGVMTSAGGQAQTTEELTALAVQAGNANFAKLWLELNGSLFSSYLIGYKGGSRIYIEARNVKFKSYQSTLSPAEVANGLEWKGSVEAVAALVRTNENGKCWVPWRNGSVMLYKMYSERKRGDWGPPNTILYDRNTNELLQPRADEIAALVKRPECPPLASPDCMPWLKRDGFCQ